MKVCGGRQEDKDSNRRKIQKERGERPSAITAVSTQNCLDEISTIRRSP